VARDKGAAEDKSLKGQSSSWWSVLEAALAPGRSITRATTERLSTFLGALVECAASPASSLKGWRCLAYAAPLSLPVLKAQVVQDEGATKV